MYFLKKTKKIETFIRNYNLHSSRSNQQALQRIPNKQEKVNYKVQPSKF